MQKIAITYLMHPILFCCERMFRSQTSIQVSLFLIFFRQCQGSGLKQI